VTLLSNYWPAALALSLECPGSVTSNWPFVMVMVMMMIEAARGGDSTGSRGGSQKTMEAPLSPRSILFEKKG